MNTNGTLAKIGTGSVTADQAIIKGRGQLVVTVTASGQATNMGQLLFQ
jgi:hypothetical protein